MKQNKADQTIALAALLQACYLVDQLSKNGSVPSENMRPLIDSLLNFSPESTAAVYNGAQNITPGLTIVNDVLSGKTASGYAEALRYAMGIMHLEKKVRHNNEMLSTIRNRLEHVEFRSNHFSEHIDDIAPAIASIYVDTLSTLKYRIQVSGSMLHLQDKLVADKIRCLLFAAVRAAILWRQVGGRRWQLLLSRRSILNSVGEIRRGLVH